MAEEQKKMKGLRSQQTLSRFQMTEMQVVVLS
jgi:hypothetical protein